MSKSRRRNFYLSGNGGRLLVAGHRPGCRAGPAQACRISQSERRLNAAGKRAVGKRRPAARRRSTASGSALRATIGSQLSAAQVLSSRGRHAALSRRAFARRPEAQGRQPAARPGVADARAAGRAEARGLLCRRAQRRVDAGGPQSHESLHGPGQRQPPGRGTRRHPSRPGPDPSRRGVRQALSDGPRARRRRTLPAQRHPRASRQERLDAHGGDGATPGPAGREADAPQSPPRSTRTAAIPVPLDTLPPPDAWHWRAR